jgi:Arc/MetJ-type ribon-helix-helix transcriptional regulator
MTIHLPHDLESSIQTAVHNGLFASVDDAMAKAARLLLRDIGQERVEAKPIEADLPPDPLLGAWSDDADLLDEIVDYAMKNRQERPRRPLPGE